MSMDSEGLLSKGLYLHIAIFLNKILPKGFFPSSANRSFNRVSAKVYCHVTFFKWGRKDSYADLFGCFDSSLNNRFFFSK